MSVPVCLTYFLTKPLLVQTMLPFIQHWQCLLLHKTNGAYILKRVMGATANILE